MKFKKILENMMGPSMPMDDHEVEMAITDLRATAALAAELAQHLENERPKELEGWVQSKITKAADYIEAVHKNHMFSPEQDCMSCGGDAVNEGRSSSKRGGPKQSWRNKIEGWMGYKGFTAFPGMTTKQTAFVITRAINKKGYKAKPWVEPAIDRVLNQDFTKIFAEGIAAEIVSILNR